MNIDRARTLLVTGGVIASLILIVFGIACIVIGFQGRQEVQDQLARENIIGTDDSDIAGQLVDTGSEAREFAETIRRHALASTDGLTYSEMGRFQTPDGNPAGTNNAEEAAVGENGQPIPNAQRDLWVTATALSTSLNMAYLAEQIGLFAIVMGVALVLTGVGFAVLTLGVLRIVRPDGTVETQRTT